MFCGWVKVNYSLVKEGAAQTVADIAGWGRARMGEGEDGEQTKHL